MENHRSDDRSRHLIISSSARAQEYTRGVGVYPGDRMEDFSPSMKIDSTNYRNIALHRPSYQSSCYNYNFTAQLITDGIKESQLPGWIVTTTSTDGIVKRNERETVLDRHMATRKTLEGSAAWLQIEMAGNSVIPDLDSMNVSGSLLVDSLRVQHWNISISGSQDGSQWKELGTTGGNRFPGDTLHRPVAKVCFTELAHLSYSFKLDTLHIINFTGFM